jgi:hypothetical protein
MRTLCLSIAAAAFTGCAALGPPPLQDGQSEAQVLQLMGPPTARHAMPAGATRLEYATGPMGRHTWMVDLDAGGRVSAWHQALDPWRLEAFQARAAGLPVEEVLRTLGTPGERSAIGWTGGEIWSWRYPTNDCLWYQATIGPDRKVRDAGFTIDLRCDGRDSRD